MGRCTKSVTLIESEIGLLRGEVSEVSIDLVGICGRKMSVNQVADKIVKGCYPVLVGSDALKVSLSDDGKVILTAGRYPNESFALIEVGQEVSDRLW